METEHFSMILFSRYIADNQKEVACGKFLPQAEGHGTEHQLLVSAHSGHLWNLYNRQVISKAVIHRYQNPLSQTNRTRVLL